MYSQTAVSQNLTFWQSRSTQSEILPADGCVDFILLDDLLWVVGPLTQRIVAPARAQATTFGIRFAPGSAAEAVRANLAELRDMRVSAQDLLGARQSARIERELRQLAASCELPQPLIPPALFQPQNIGWAPRVHQAARRQLPLAAATKALGWSERHLRRRMTAEFGYGYHTLVRIERAQRASELIAQGNELGATASIAGYADQAHMTRELTRFSGRTPGQLLGSAA